MDTVSFEEFAKMDIRIGLIRAAERVPETDKLIKCAVDFGDPSLGGGMRTIISGIAAYKTPEDLIGKKLLYIVNLAPRLIRGVESQGMLLALSYGENNFSLLVPEDGEVPPGTKVR